MSDATPRRIVLLRHAKADWPDVPDRDRPLADRGRLEAPAAGRWLAGAGIVPRLVLCSPAVRTRETWKLAAGELPQRPRTAYDERLYEATTGDLLAVLNGVDDEIPDVALVGHNPGMHGVADALAGHTEGDALARMRRGGFPTASVAVLEFEGSWKSVEHGVARLTSYWAPSRD
jgi:phosphohistidine phosphatase